MYLLEFYRKLREKFSAGIGRCVTTLIGIDETDAVRIVNMHAVCAGGVDCWNEPGDPEVGLQYRSDGGMVPMHHVLIIRLTGKLPSAFRQVLFTDRWTFSSSQRA